MFNIKQMNILFVTHYTSLMGANRSLLTLIDELAEYGHRCFVMLPDTGELVAELEKRDIGHLFLFHYWIQKEKNPSENIWDYYKKGFEELKDNYRFSEKLRGFVNENKINVIYSNSSVISIGALAAIRFRIRHIYHLREFGDLDYNLTFSIPRFLALFLFRRSDYVICISKSLRQHFFKNAKASFIKCVYNGIYSLAELESMAKSREAQPADPTFHIAIVGLVRREKGQKVALGAFVQLLKKYPHLHLHIVGPVGDAEYLRPFENNLTHVTFHDYVADTSPIYKMASLALVCSDNEAFGRVTIEAMAWGVPVIGYDNAGTSEIISDMEDGILYSPNTSDTLANKIEFVLNNPLIVKDIVKNARKKVETQFSRESYGGQIHKLIETIA